MSRGSQPADRPELRLGHVHEAGAGGLVTAHRLVRRPTRNGAPQPVLHGRLFLFTADDRPAGVDGQLVVELVDGEETLREKWVFTPVRLVTRYEPTSGGPTRTAVSVVELGAGDR